MCILQIEGFFWIGCISHNGFIFWWISWPVVVEEMMTVLASRTHGLFLPFQFKQTSLYVWLKMKLATPHLVWHRSQNLSKLETLGFVLEMFVWLSKCSCSSPWFLIYFLKVYVQTWSTQNLTMTITRDEYPSYPMVLRGINQKAAFPQYQPVIMLEKGYTIHWNGPAPKTVFLYLINFNKYVPITITSHSWASRNLVEKNSNTPPL